MAHVCCPRACEGEPGSVWRTLCLGRSLGLEVGGADVEELAEGRGTELTTEEPPDLQREQQQPAAEGALQRREGGYSHFADQGMLGKWGEMQSFTGKYHPDRSSKLSNTFVQ